MVKNIVVATDPVLRIVSKPVGKIDKKIKSLIEDLKDTLVVQEDPEGVGLAACQIGKPVRVFAMKPKDKIKIIINPKIVSQSKVEKQSVREKNKIMEGCLSLPNLYSPIVRSTNITISYISECGTEKIEEFEGFDAQIIQHEIDHLEGHLFIDKLVKQNKPLYEYKEGEWERVEIV